MTQEAPRRMAWWKRIFLALVFLFGALQLWQPDRSNPPVAGDFDGPADVEAILRKACYDCHSNETVWPFYAYVAPVSWLVAKDVHAGREELNFSDWTVMDEDDREEKRERCWDEVEEGNMPLPIYLPLHPEARLTEAERQIIKAWSRGD